MRKLNTSKSIANRIRKTIKNIQSKGRVAMFQGCDKSLCFVSLIMLIKNWICPSIWMPHPADNSESNSTFVLQCGVRKLQGDTVNKNSSMATRAHILVNSRSKWFTIGIFQFRKGKLLDSWNTCVIKSLAKGISFLIKSYSLASFAHRSSFASEKWNHPRVDMQAPWIISVWMGIWNDDKRLNEKEAFTAANE